MNEPPGRVAIIDGSEAAKLLKMRAGAMNRWLERERPAKLPVIKVGRGKKFILADVERYVESRNGKQTVTARNPRGMHHRISHKNLLQWCGIHRDMIVSLKIAAKLLNADENFLLEKIEQGRLKIMNVFEGEGRILLSHARREIALSKNAATGTCLVQSGEWHGEVQHRADKA
jgi:hypothetical protein